MNSLVALEVRRIIGRRGSFFGTMAVPFAIAVLAAGLGASDLRSGEAWASIIGIPLVFGATVVAALEGSYDLSQGTMRYLVLTGVPRWKLVALRVPAVLIAIVLIALPAMLVGGAAMANAGVPGAELARGLGSALTFALSWGLVAMAVGTLLQSNGAGIAVALVFYLAANIITAVVRSQVSEAAGDFLLPNVVSVVARFGGEAPVDGPLPSTMAFGTAAVVLVVWLVGIVGLAIARVERDEY
jgi:ABC-type transport system involved in multi-copper enzyme maturation permease subunit